MSEKADPKSFDAMLRNAGLKATRQRAAVLRVLAESEEPLAAQDVHRLLRRRIEADLSTVYRSLESMAEKGLLLKTVLSAVRIQPNAAPALSGLRRLQKDPAHRPLSPRGLRALARGADRLQDLKPQAGGLRPLPRLRESRG